MRPSLPVPIRPSRTQSDPLQSLRGALAQAANYGTCHQINANRRQSSFGYRGCGQDRVDNGEGPSSDDRGQRRASDSTFRGCIQDENGEGPSSPRRATRESQGDSILSKPVIKHAPGPRYFVFGLPRTGTGSVCSVLASLGHWRVYDSNDSFKDNPKFWDEAFSMKCRDPTRRFGRAFWDRLLWKAHVVTGFPALCFAEDLIDAYPDAKVIVTIRDNPETWADSFMETHHKDFAPYGPLYKGRFFRRRIHYSEMLSWGERPKMKKGWSERYALCQNIAWFSHLAFAKRYELMYTYFVWNSEMRLLMTQRGRRNDLLELTVDWGSPWRTLQEFTGNEVSHSPPLPREWERKDFEYQERPMREEKQDTWRTRLRDHFRDMKFTVETRHFFRSM